MFSETLYIKPIKKLIMVMNVHCLVLFCSMFKVSVEIEVSDFALADTYSCDSEIVSPWLFRSRISIACGTDWKHISRPQMDWEVVSFSTSSQVRRVVVSTPYPSSFSRHWDSLLDWPGWRRTTIVVLY